MQGAGPKATTYAATVDMPTHTCYSHPCVPVTKLIVIICIPEQKIDSYGYSKCPYTRFTNELMQAPGTGFLQEAVPRIGCYNIGWDRKILLLPGHCLGMISRTSK